MNNNDFSWLSQWYLSHCNGDWEHGTGIRIETIDNPGWSVSINLMDTDLQEKEFQKVELENSEDDWLICFKKNNSFEGRCSPENLIKVIQIFRAWIEDNIISSKN
jgi:hypothetical protein